MSIEKNIMKEAMRFGVGDLSELSAAQLHEAVACAVMKKTGEKFAESRSALACERTAFYMSAEFLMGRAVYCNLQNMLLTERVKNLLKEKGIDFGVFEEISDAALGNGGLGRLAACFLDSAATLGKRLYGYGIRYRYGLFRQKFENGFQKEEADNWQSFGDPWSVRNDSDKKIVSFKNTKVYAVPYDTPIIGYGGECVNALRLWQSEPTDEFDFEKFDKGSYSRAFKNREDAEKISAVLYPNDSRAAGRKLRLMQQYFFASASLQDIIDTFKKKRIGLSKLPKRTVIQLNDTHPTVAVAELIRLLECDGMSFEEAFEIARKTFAYTNHTVMSEALETWDKALFKRVIPEVYKVIETINRRFCAELKERGESEDGRLIIDGGRIHMARLACYMCFAVNGVAKIHTEIIKADTLERFYSLQPNKFFNETNGITQRRWLLASNPLLSGFITERIGDKWIKDLSELKKLEKYADDVKSLNEFRDIKRRNKEALCEYISRKEGVSVNPDFIFDVQIKRLHEYKRQLLNAFSILAIYFGLKDGSVKDFKPTLFLFGAKAAPAYTRAKGIIKFINEIAKKTDADAETRDRLKVLFVTDYNVSYAEKIVAAADVSEQISAAGTEASGTGNMKLMLGGAVTLGTYDGANIEIAQSAGEENEYIFGAKAEELKAIENFYDPKIIYESNPVLKRAVDTLIDGTFCDGGTGMFAELYSSLLEGASWHRPDNYFLFKDFDSYLETKLKVNADYGNDGFVRKCFLNTANAGRFSSDRTVLGYCKDIWSI